MGGMLNISSPFWAVRQLFWMGQQHADLGLWAEAERASFIRVAWNTDPVHAE